MCRQVCRIWLTADLRSVSEVSRIMGGLEFEIAAFLEPRQMKYGSIKAVKQMDPTCCWAASLEWWIRARQTLGSYTQVDILGLYAHLYEKNEASSEYGTVNKAAMFKILGDVRWGMSTRWIMGHQFTDDEAGIMLAKGPMIVGYFEPDAGGNHVVVMYEFSGSSNMKVMDPNSGRHRTWKRSKFRNQKELVLGYLR